MDHPHTVKVPESFQDLARILATDSLTQTPVSFAEVSYAPTAHVLQVDAEYVVLGDFSAVVVDYVLVVKKLESVYLMFQRFYFLLVKTLERVYKLNLLDNEHFARISVHSLIDFACHSLPYYFALDPLDNLALGLDGRLVIFDKVVLESLLHKHSLLEHLLVSVKLLQSLRLIVIGHFG